MKLQVEELIVDEMKVLGVYFQGKKVGFWLVKDFELLVVGKFVFNCGNQFSGLFSCLSCYGLKGLGMLQLLCLVGQYLCYIEDQLKQFNKCEWINDNVVMYIVVFKFFELEIYVVVEYIVMME